MATFQEQVEGITQLSIGSTPTTSELTQFLSDGAEEVINILPSNLLVYCTNQDTFTSTAIDAESKILNGKKVIDVFAGGYEARQINPKKKYEAARSTSINYATATDPVFYIQNNNINVLPAGISCKYNEVTYPTVTYDSDNILNFPDNCEYLVTLYASIKTLLAHIGGLTIPPDAFGDATSLTSNAQDITNGQTGTDAEFKEFDMWFTALGEMIEDDEDVELASAQIEKINSYVNTWNIQLQGNLADFQRYSAILQQVRADYAQGITMLKTGGAIPAQQKGR